MKSMLKQDVLKAAPFQGPPLSLIPDTGGVLLFYGDPALFSLSSLLAGWRLDQGERVIFLDGGNCFDPYPLIKLAKEIGRDPQDFLASLFVSRAFTCHQMGSLIFNQLRGGIKEHHPGMIILASPLATFYDESVPYIEAKNLLMHLVAALRQLPEKPLLVILARFPEKSAGRRTFFLSHLKGVADRVFRVKPAEHSIQASICITEEKPE